MRSESLELLNQIQSIVSKTESLGMQEEDMVKNTFLQILQNGDTFNILEIENWLTRENILPRPVLDRILNIAHYQKSKFEANNKFKMLSDDCGCDCQC